MADSPNPDELLDVHMRLPPHVVHRSFVAETVVLNLRTGKYHGLNATAGEILNALEEGATLREAGTKLAEAYGRAEAATHQDALELCQGLLERGLIEVTDSAIDDPGD